MITEMTTIATTMLVATLPAALFLFGGSVGTETKLFRTPHRGQARLLITSLLSMGCYVNIFAQVIAHIQDQYRQLHEEKLLRNSR